MLLFYVQDSAVNMQELEEALVIVKQRREETNPELEFLHKVDDEKNKGLSVSQFIVCSVVSLLQ